MSLSEQQVSIFEKAGGFILDQMVAAHAITREQQENILAQQAQIEQDTGEKPFVGALLEQNGIPTADLKQPLLDLQASSRALLYSHGQTAAAQRCEGGQAPIDLTQGVPDNKWTVADMESGNPAKEQTALLQTRLLQTKVLTTAANMLEANGQDVPASTLTAIRACQDAAREGFGAANTALKVRLHKRAESLDYAHHNLPQPMTTVSQQDILQGAADAITQLQQSNLLTPEQADTLLSQEATRSQNISTMQARRQARQQAPQLQQASTDKPQAETSHAQNVVNARANQQGSGRGM